MDHVFLFLHVCGRSCCAKNLNNQSQIIKQSKEIKYIVTNFKEFWYLLFPML